jgi:hypothetical protein
VFFVGLLVGAALTLKFGSGHLTAEKEREFQQRKIRNEAYADSLAFLKIKYDSISNKVEYYESIHSENIADLDRSTDRLRGVVARRLNASESAVEISKLLHRSDSVRRRFWDFLSDSVRYKDSIRTRILDSEYRKVNPRAGSPVDF